MSSQWISVKDRIPVKSDANEDGRVWFYDKEEKQIGKCCWNAAGFKWGRTERPTESLHPCGFSHWMPAEDKPKPPTLMKTDHRKMFMHFQHIMLELENGYFKQGENADTRKKSRGAVRVMLRRLEHLSIRFADSDAIRENLKEVKRK